MLTIALACLAAYLLGSVPTGLVLVRRVRGIDLRETGSGGTGATNVARQLGLRVGLVVAALDLAKGWIAVAWIPSVFATLQPQALPSWLAPAVGVAAVAGHAWSLFAGFRGGRGVATAGGATLALSWPAFLVVLALFVVGVAWTRRVSVGSLMALVGLVPAVWLLPNGLPQAQALLYASLICIIGVVRHAGNLRRLLGGTERRL